MLLVAAAAAYFYLRRTPTLTETDTIVLGDFTNTTGDPVFDNTLRQGLAAQLQQSPFLSLVTDDRIGKTLALMQQPPDARLTPDIAQGVCVRTASAVVLDGSIASLGSQYILGLRARNCATGDVLADEQAQVARKEDVLGSLSQMATQVRERLGESRVTIEKYSRPFQEATTASLDAWKAFTTANQVYMSSGRARAQPLFERAIAIDPDFAIAHARLGVYYSYEGESALSRQSTIRRTSCGIARATPSDSTSRWRTTGRSPAIWTGRWRRWKRGRNLSARFRTSRTAGRLRHAEHRQIRAVDRRSREFNGS